MKVAVGVRSSDRSVRRRRVRQTELRAVYARSDNSILDLPDVHAAVDGGRFDGADPRDFIPLPRGSLLLTLPGRSVCGFVSGKLTVIDSNGANGRGETINAVAAALPLGYTRLQLPAYKRRAGAPALPLYGYTAVAWSGDGFYVAAAHTDRLETWSPKVRSQKHLSSAIAAREKEFPNNVMVAQLKRCATEYGCYTAQNTFLRQGEAALAVSAGCNARCLGCISAQDPGSGIVSAQERLKVQPNIDEISMVALAHLRANHHGIVSFGQGCEGEPLLATPLIAQSIRTIRSQISVGIIHCNTNASRPRSLQSLIEAGLQSIRVSLNSARADIYAAYYRPRGYDFNDVRKSLAIAAGMGVTISLNLLTHPGVTDHADEMESFAGLLREFPISMVQTRTLNVDPQVYFSAVGRPATQPVGMRGWLQWLRAEFPNVRVGNFTRGFG